MSRSSAPAAPGRGATTALAVGALLLLLPAGPAGAVAPVEGTSSSAERLLERAAGAARTLTWSGTQFVSAWSRGTTTSHVVEVAHRPGDGLSVRVDAAVGHSEAVATLPDGADPAGAAGAGALALLSDRYALSVGTPGRVAGRVADVVDVRRSEQGPPAARFWLDRDTGLVLRREVYDTDGRRVRASAYVDLVVGAVDRAVAGRRAPTPLRGRRLDAAALDALRAEGWPAPASLGDLPLHDARSRTGDAGRLLHLTYSDGLSSVSLFAERGHLDTRGLDGWDRRRTTRGEVWVRDGVPQQVTWPDGSRVLTVVADAPPQTVAAVVRALPHAQEGRGVTARLGRGVSRVLSWLNPFD